MRIQWDVGTSHVLVHVCFIQCNPATWRGSSAHHSHSCFVSIQRGIWKKILSSCACSKAFMCCTYRTILFIFFPIILSDAIDHIQSHWLTHVNVQCWTFCIILLHEIYSSEYSRYSKAHAAVRCASLSSRVQGGSPSRSRVSAHAAGTVFCPQVLSIFATSKCIVRTFVYVTSWAPGFLPYFWVDVSTDYTLSFSKRQWI